MTNFGPIIIYQDGKQVKELCSVAGIAADHHGWRGYSLYNVDITMGIQRVSRIDTRYFADMKCITRFPEFDQEFIHNASCDIPAGQAIGDAIFRSFAIPLNFKEPHDTVMEVEFTIGNGPLANLRVPIKYPIGIPVKTK